MEDARYFLDATIDVGEALDFDFPEDLPQSIQTNSAFSQNLSPSDPLLVPPFEHSIGAESLGDMYDGLIDPLLQTPSLESGIGTSSTEGLVEDTSSLYYTWTPEIDTQPGPCRSETRGLLGVTPDLANHL